MPDGDSKIVEIYLQWLYTGTLVLLESDTLEADRRGHTQRSLLIKLCILADSTGDSALYNAAIDTTITVLSKSTDFWSPRNVAKIYGNLPGGKPATQTSGGLLHLLD